ncbi:hypothetical protein QWR64_004002 [Escherichia coli]|nr:hypothetical protein [Escherichia coli]
MKQYENIVVEFIDNLKLNYHKGDNLNHIARIAAKRICKSTKDAGVFVSVSKAGSDAIDLVIGNRNKRELQLFRINYSTLGGELVAECDVNNPVIL